MALVSFLYRFFALVRGNERILLSQHLGFILFQSTFKYLILTRRLVGNTRVYLDFLSRVVDEVLWVGRARSFLRSCVDILQHHSPLLLSALFFNALFHVLFMTITVERVEGHQGHEK